MTSPFPCPNTRRSPRLAAALSVLVAALLGFASHADAQNSMFTPYVGGTTGGDTRTTGTTWGFSTAYIEENGWGAEFDVAHATAFNDVEFEQSSLTTVMVNLKAAPRVSRWVWPFGVVGVGLIRARACSGRDCVTTISRTDFGLNAGGGAYVPVNDFFAVRGDVRYFRYAQIHRDLPRTDNGPFDFWRISGGGTFMW
jgi:opacity protein-like surface antigen